MFAVAPGRAAELQGQLEAALPGDADWRPVPHARFSVKANDVVFTCYTSGKVVVQGRDLDNWLARFVPELGAALGRPEELVFDGPTIGSDEVGKGDYFGPLVVAAAFATPAQRPALLQLGVADSKTIADARALRLAAALGGQLEHKVVVLDPPDYNARHARSRNVNLVLAELHAEAIAPLLTAHPDAGIVVDQFADATVLESALRATLGSRPRRLLQTPRGERHPVVAAASIMARAAFLESLVRLSADCATDLHKGAGEPVDVCAQRVFDIGGRELLGKVAKLHFKNTQRIRGA